MTTELSTETKTTDVLLRRVLIITTALSLAAAYGWLACFDRQPDGNLYFHWRWIAAGWIAIGFGSSFYFWRKIWPPIGGPVATRNGIIKGSIVLVLPCLWWLTFPLRFLSGQHFWDVAIGLTAAAIVLSFGAWMVIHLIKAFERSDTEDLKALDFAAGSAGEKPKAKE